MEEAQKRQPRLQNDSFEGIKMADIYILTKIQCYQDWIIREIDERLLL